LLLSIKPFDVHRPSCSRNYSIFQLFDCLLCVRQWCKFYQRWACEAVTLSNEFDIEDLSKLLEEFPNIVLFPAGRQVSNIHNQFDLFRWKFFFGGNWRLRTFSWFLFFLNLFFLLRVFFWVGIASRHQNIISKIQYNLL